MPTNAHPAIAARMLAASGVSTESVKPVYRPAVWFYLYAIGLWAILIALVYYLVTLLA